jgi:hypothetical protein
VTLVTNWKATFEGDHDEAASNQRRIFTGDAFRSKLSGPAIPNGSERTSQTADVEFESQDRDDGERDLESNLRAD